MKQAYGVVGRLAQVMQHRYLPTGFNGRHNGIVEQFTVYNLRAREREQKAARCHPFQSLYVRAFVPLYGPVLR